MTGATGPQGHARLSHSGATRWAECAGAPSAEANHPDSSSEAAERGTAAHELWELGVDETLKFQNTTRPTMSNGVQLEAEDIAAVRVAEKYVEDAKYDLMLREQRVLTDKALDRPDCWGTADLIGKIGDIMEIVDYKHGSGIFVEAENNYSLILYAIGALWLPEFHDCKFVKMTIIQPRIDNAGGPIRTTPLMSVEELLEWRDFFKARADATDDPSAPRTPGDKQCQWCKARHQCPELARFAQKQSLVAFDDVTLAVNEKSALRSPETLTPEQVSTILDNEKLITSWIKSVKEHAMSRALAGHPPPSYKLVAGRKSKSFTMEEEAVEKKLRGMKKLDGKKVAKADITVTKLASLAQVVKIMKPLVSPSVFKNVEKLIKTNEGSPTLVPVTDSRPALPSKVEQAFDGIETEKPEKGGESTPDLSALFS